MKQMLTMMTVDYDELMKRNLTSVFSETDADARTRAIADMYSSAPTLYEPNSVVYGRQAISETVDKLLKSLPPGFTFRVAGPVVGHHDLCCVQWTGGPPENPTMISGTDVVQFEGGKIKSLYVLINPAQE